jgi:hypothetical protein
LDEGAGGLSCFDDDGGFGERRHGDVAFGEEAAVDAPVLFEVPAHGYLADEEVVARDFCLEFLVLFGVGRGEWCSDDGDGWRSGADGGVVRYRVDARGEAGDDGEPVVGEQPRELFCAFRAFSAGLSCADDGDATGVDEIPIPLVVQEFDRVFGVAQLFGVFARTVQSDAVVFHPALLEEGVGSFRKLLRNFFVHREEVRRERSGMCAEFLREGLEPHLGFEPKGFIRTHLHPRRDGLVGERVYRVSGHGCSSTVPFFHDSEEKAKVKSFSLFSASSLIPVTMTFSFPGSLPDPGPTMSVA